jgi:hypothetical protein
MPIRLLNMTPMPDALLAKPARVAFGELLAAGWRLTSV